MIRKHKKLVIIISVVLAVLLAFAGTIHYLQTVHVHKTAWTSPSYPRVELTLKSDNTTIFLQTGLGFSAAEKLKKAGDLASILEAQEYFFNPPKYSCDYLEFITREDRFEDEIIDFVDLQPGDILLSLSTHSLGWRHGHAGLVIDEDTVLEAEVIGSNSRINPLFHFGTYTNFAHMRLKNVTPEMQQEIVEFSKQYLDDVPYSLTAGFFGKKAPPPDSKNLKVQCSYLVWYAYNHFGYDLDSDGGRLVSTYDILHSDKLEVVQLFGMNPKDFI